MRNHWSMLVIESWTSNLDSRCVRSSHSELVENNVLMYTAKVSRYKVIWTECYLVTIYLHAAYLNCCNEPFTFKWVHVWLFHTLMIYSYRGYSPRDDVHKTYLMWISVSIKHVYNPNMIGTSLKLSKSKLSHSHTHILRTLPMAIADTMFTIQM